MRKILFVIVLCIVIVRVSAFSSDLVYTNADKKKTNEVSLIKSEPNEMILKVKVNSYTLKKHKLGNNEAFVVSTTKGTSLLEEGAPDLAKFTESLIITDLSSMSIEVVSSKYIEISDILILPSKGNLTRDIDPSSIDYKYGKEYSIDQFYPGKIADLRDPYILRDYRGQTVIFMPFQYNPVTKVLRIYTEFVVRVFEDARKAVNIFDRAVSNKKLVNEYDNIYKDHFLNYSHSRYSTIAEDGELLVISHPNFIEAMQPYVAWKNQKGIKTTMVDVTTIGTTSASIKTYISNFYSSRDLSFVLLVGDAAFVPTVNSTSGSSDNSYGYLTGTDSYPEVFVGRFSAETVPHVNTMVNRILNYEMTPAASALYGNSIGIGSDQGPGDDNELDYQHIRNMQADLNAFTYTDAAEFFDGSQGGDDASGNPTPAQISSELNSGAGIIVYTGHGSTTSFGTSGFSNTNVNSLTNTLIQPFIWAVACVNGDFVSNTCFAEAWTRASYNYQPAGAIATLMSTINQSWNPPMCAQDEMVDILVGSYTNNIKRTFAGISLNGCMQMNDEYGSGGYSMTDTWNLFGDPTVVVRTAIPTGITANHAPTTFIGSNQFQVNCTTEGALVSLTIGTEILGTGLITGGIANISFAALANIGTITVTITAFNKIPYIGSVDIVPNNGPYVVFNSLVIQDPAGNNNGLADFSEDLILNISLSNVGIEMANGVTGILSSTDPNLTITNANYTFGNIDSSAVLLFPSAFALTVDGFITDQHISGLTLVLTDSYNNTWASNFSILLNAPVIEIEFDGIDDTGQIENGRLDPGETVTLSLFGYNTGHVLSPSSVCTVSSTSPFINVINSSVIAGPIDVTGQPIIYSDISVSSSTPVGTMVDLTFTLDAGPYSATTTVYKKVGLIVEDWESSDFLSYAWDNDQSYPWIVNSNSPYEGDFNAQSGTISHNQASTLSLTFESLVADTLSFFKKVSSEEPGYYGVYDYLEFKIDNVSKGQWGGEIDWSKEAYFLTAGTHTLKWTYLKDASVSEGNDCAWIDFIVLPPLNMNYAPFFMFNNDTIYAETGSPLNVTIDAFDSNSGDILEMGVNNLPAWLNFTDNGDWTAGLTGTPASIDYGNSTIDVWVNDGIASPVNKSIVISVNFPDGIDEIDLSEDLIIYPNPVVNNATINIRLDRPDKVSLNIYNTLGEIVGNVFTDKLFDGGDISININTEKFSEGVYYLKLESESYISKKKFIIVR